jgi:hypothetical protein
MMTSGRRSFEDGARLWDKGGIQPKAPKREPRAGYWLTDGQAIYGHLRQEARQSARVAAKPEPKLARGLLPDAKRGSVSPLGGQARPEPRRPGMKW